jgi:hypothetical protein
MMSDSSVAEAKQKEKKKWDLQPDRVNSDVTERISVI